MSADTPYCGEPNLQTGQRCSETEGHDSMLNKGGPTPHSVPASPARESAYTWTDPQQHPQWEQTRPGS